MNTLTTGTAKASRKDYADLTGGPVYDRALCLQVEILLS